MPRPRNQTARRAQLLEAALQVINERGPANLQMKDVAGAAGLATGSVYYYYDNVDELLRHVHALAYERYYTSQASGGRRSVPDARGPDHARWWEWGCPSQAARPLSLALYQVGGGEGARPAARRDDHQPVRRAGSFVRSGLLDEGVESRATSGRSARRIASPRTSSRSRTATGWACCTGNHDYDFDEAMRSVLEAVDLWTQCPELLPVPAAKARRRRV